MQLKQIVQDLLDNSKEIKKIRKQMQFEICIINDAYKKGYDMLFVKERLESIQSYHWLYKDNIPKPNTLCGYCQEHNKDFDDDEACKQCLKDME